MAILPIVEVPDPRLKTVSEPVGGVDDDLRAFMDDMLETMYDAPGIGLAAIQVGRPIRVLVIDLQELPEGETDEDKRIREPLYFVNPEILEVSEEVTTYNEGCLSVPEQYAEVDRPSWIMARWLDYDGNQHEEKIDGFLATVLQHEMDHLEGILFIDHLSKLKRDMVLKKLKKMRKMAA
ncbi:peptide deformylase [Pacificimonas flava]|uniref:Peptide deformylase n=2 Tax=Pacificimonas TaxID=1960290 RepID=A0A219B9Q3_9SPHN|nr:MULTISPECIES: peptide deformylase [Pacificimonas]MBZ6379990.1 peptide deformylase [Pacificimonas aurantium]OWV34508.1 peptide deformylase [Pacificimonas flava]